MIRRPPRSTQSRSSAASDVYKRQVEAQAQDGPLALVENAHARLEHGSVLGNLVFVLFASNRLEWVEFVVVRAGADRERERAVGTAGLERLEHVLLARPGRFGQLGDRRRATELGRQPVDDCL